MPVLKFLSQKIRNPKSKGTDDKYIETMYLREASSSDPTPVIYMHGKLADKEAVDSNNLSGGCVKTNHINQRSIITNHIEDLQITTPKIANDAITASKIKNESITSEEIDPFDFGEVIKTKETELKYKNTGVLIFRPVNDQEGEERLYKVVLSTDQ